VTECNPRRVVRNHQTLQGALPPARMEGKVTWETEKFPPFNRPEILCYSWSMCPSSFSCSPPPPVNLKTRFLLRGRVVTSHVMTSLIIEMVL
jgi:hypothetical protein